jgi:hypothetical protein
MSFLNPKLSIYYDVDKIKGAYIEAGVSHDIPLSAELRSPSALAGFSAGQEVNDNDPSELANFTRAALPPRLLAGPALLGGSPVHRASVPLPGQ